MSEVVNPEKSKDKGKNKPKPTPAQIALRREKISELMLAGIGEGKTRRIAEYLTSIGIECCKSTVATDIKALLKTAAKNVVKNLDEKRELANNRLESLIEAHWLDAQKKNFQAGYFVRTLINDQIDLYGLKGAKKVELQGKDGGPIKVSNSVDLSNLSKEELLLMEALVAKTSAEKIDSEKKDAA